MILTEEAIYWSTHDSLTAGQFKKQDYVMNEQILYGEQIETTKQRLEQHAIGGVHLRHDYYPQRFRHVADFCPVLYWKGNLGLLQQPLLGIVGPRMVTVYQKKITEDLCQELGSYVLGVVSGGAEGIDMLTHTLCMEYAIPTVVILGGGFRRYQHRHERTFFERVVAQGGCVISPWKINQGPTHYTFPQRNKLIAAAAQALFVPGAAEGSGTCITIDFALDFGIPVFSVPGSLYDPGCSATNVYLAERKVAFCIDYNKFLGNFFVKKTTGVCNQEAYVVGSDEQRVLAALSVGIADIDNLCVETKIPVASLLGILSCLEIEQRVYTKQGCWYKK